MSAARRTRAQKMAVLKDRCEKMDDLEETCAKTLRKTDALTAEMKGTLLTLATVRAQLSEQVRFGLLLTPPPSSSLLGHSPFAPRQQEESNAALRDKERRSRVRSGCAIRAARRARSDHGWTDHRAHQDRGRERESGHRRSITAHAPNAGPPITGQSGGAGARGA